FGAREGATAIGGGLEALVDLDEGAPSSRAREAEARGELKPLLAEYVWWFIGTLLVLAGSVMGVREAWRALAGPPRQVVIAGALSTPLVAVFVPLLVAELPLGGAMGDGVARVALPFVGVIAAAVAGARLVMSERMAAGLASFVAAMYGAIALGLFALLGVPG